MRNRLLLCFLFAVLLCSSRAQGPVYPNNGMTYDWASVSTTGQLGSYLFQYQGGVTSGSSNFTIDWGVSGTAASACTFRVEGSPDGTNWTGLDVTSPSADPLPCTTANMVSFAYKPARFIRVYIVSYTAGDSTTSVKFHYTRGSM